MLLCIILPVRLDPLHPSGICAGVEYGDNDNRRTTANGDLGDVGQGRWRASTYYAQQPEQCQEAQHSTDNEAGLVPQQISERRRHKRRGLIVARRIGRRPRGLARRHGEVHGEGVGPGGQEWAAGGSNDSWGKSLLWRLDGAKESSLGAAGQRGEAAID